jgi:hypothetical protein
MRENGLMLMRKTLPLWVLSIVLAMPSGAAADTFLTPYFGWTFSSQYAEAELPTKFAYGADLMWLGTSGVGFEVDFGYHPNFFQPGEDDDFFDFESDGNVVTFMGNLVFGYSGGGVQPYVTGGFGLMRTNIEDVGGLFGDISDTAWGVNAGGGLRMGSPKLAVRGDLRYFRQLSDLSIGDVDVDLGTFSYWRGTIGLSMGF